MNNLNTDWRKIASSIYRKPSDSKIFGAVEIDVDDLEKYITRKRREGEKITLTHFFTLVVARALREEVPELNCYLRRGKVIKRKQIDATVSVLLEGSQMSSVRLNNADQLTLPEAAAIIREKIRDTRAGEASRTMKSGGGVSSVPWPLRAWLFRLIRLITINLGIPLPWLGLPRNSFGSFLISNIGTLGLETGYPALFPVSDVAFVLIMGGVTKKPVVVDEKIVIRKMLSLSIALDHRVVDAWHGGKLFRYIKYMVDRPALLESVPDRFSHDKLVE